jgi:hypothetical protein
MIMTTLVLLHVPGAAVLIWLLRDLRRSDPAESPGDTGGGGRRVPPPRPSGYRWSPRRGRRRPLPRRPLRRAARAGR